MSPLTHPLADTLLDLCEQFYEHPEGIDPPFDNLNLYQHCKTECSKFAQIEAKAGDVFITHGMIPHAHTPNHLHYPRIITNPHVNLAEPFNLNRPDGDYVSAGIPTHTLDLDPGLALTPADAVRAGHPPRARPGFYPRVQAHEGTSLVLPPHGLLQAREGQGRAEAHD